jgi:hypothetical protein
MRRRGHEYSAFERDRHREERSNPRFGDAAPFRRAGDLSTYRIASLRSQ